MNNTVYRQNRVNNIIEKYVNIFGTSVLKYCYDHGFTLSLVCSLSGDITYSDEWLDSEGRENVPCCDGWETVDIDGDDVYYEDFSDPDNNGHTSFNLSDYVYTNPTIGELCNI